MRGGANNTNNWATRLGWKDRRQAYDTTLPPLDRNGVEEVLSSMGNPIKNGWQLGNPFFDDRLPVYGYAPFNPLQQIR